MPNPNKLEPKKGVSPGYSRMTRLRFVPLLSIAVLLLFTFRLYTAAFLSTDDFNNLYWVQQQSAAQMLWHVVNPASQFFRPAGMMFYWLLLHLFDLKSGAYHFLAWSFHAANTALVYFILKRVTESRAGAAIGAMLFACEAAFEEIYWSFGTIFELSSAFTMFAGILLWMKERRSWPRLMFCFFAFFFAVKAKEMAIILPGVWLGCDLLLRQKPSTKVAAQVLLPGAFGLWYGLSKMNEMRQPSPADPYYMDMRWLTLGRGYGGYFDQLFQTHLRWQVWAIAFAALLLLFALMRNRVAAFFQLYVFVTFLPVIFLVNHREIFYWYIPMLGLCGLAALLVKSVVQVIEPRIPARITPAAAAVLFAVLCWEMYAAQRNETDARRRWQQQIAIEYRSWVTSVRSRPQPAANATVFFDSYPSNFNEIVLQSAAQVALRRTDINAKLTTREQ